jgi:uncharacterized protein YcgL (UPF0745 family)
MGSHPVYKPFHYTQGDVECIDAMMEAFGQNQVSTYCKLNAFKYLWRAGLKEYIENDNQDIQKAIWYLKFAIGEDPRAETREEEVPRKPH